MSRKLNNKVLSDSPAPKQRSKVSNKSSKANKSYVQNQPHGGVQANKKYMMNIKRKFGNKIVNQEMTSAKKVPLVNFVLEKDKVVKMSDTESSTNTKAQDVQQPSISHNINFTNYSSFRKSNDKPV